MIIRNAYSARPVTRGRPGQGFTPPFPDRADPDDTIGQSGLIRPETGDELAHDLPDQPRLVFIDFGRSGFAAPFHFIPFHGGRYGD